ncbi:MAG TPA: xanthine dehydrogenase small subunit [Myxococcaceae bacterium]|nr:xanthine dehydrogenase small subunit [Myxococcaceae bacterium]
MDAVRFELNGRPVEVRGAAPTTTLLRWLRDSQGLCGTKEGCAEGDCGACTVAFIDSDVEGKSAYRAVNSCLVLLPMLQGRRIVTVEGLKQDGAWHPVQESLARHLGSQCGYCTPGVAMSLFEACYRADLNEPWQVDDQMCGNLCRCTGYRPIRDAAEELKGKRPADAFARSLEQPAEAAMGLSYTAGTQRADNPTSLDALFRVLDAHPAARIICGGTDLSLEVTKRFKELPHLVSVEGIPEARRIEKTASGWSIGAAVTLTDLQDALKGGILSLEKMLRFFASRQIKNRATVGGNLCNASPIGDLAPVLLSLGARVTLASGRGQRTLALEDFFLGYRKTALGAGEILLSVEIPALGPDVRATSFKVSKRRELDISAVAAGCWARVDGSNRIVDARLGFGGVAATPARARKVEAALIGKPWKRETFEAAAALTAQDFAPISDHRGSAWYRAQLAKNLVLAFYVEHEQGTSGLDPRPTSTVHLRTA